MGSALQPYAAVTDTVVLWGRAPHGLAFLADKGLPRSTPLFALSQSDYAELDRNGWVGVAAERIIQRGCPVTFEAAPC